MRRTNYKGSSTTKLRCAGISGGVMASRFVAENEQRIKGMIYLADYPDEKVH